MLLHPEVPMRLSQFNICIDFSVMIICIPSPRSQSLHPTVLSTSTPSPWPPFTQSFRWLLIPGLRIQQALSTTQLRSVSVFEFTGKAVFYYRLSFIAKRTKMQTDLHNPHCIFCYFLGTDGSSRKFNYPLALRMPVLP